MIQFQNRAVSLSFHLHMFVSLDWLNNWLFHFLFSFQRSKSPCSWIYAVFVRGASKSMKIERQKLLRLVLFINKIIESQVPSLYWTVSHARLRASWRLEPNNISNFNPSLSLSTTTALRQSYESYKFFRIPLEREEQSPWFRMILWKKPQNTPL